MSCSQLLDLGATPSQMRAQVAAERWRCHLPGVYAVQNGPVDELTRIWASVFYAGAGAAAGHSTALWLFGVFDDPPAKVQLVIPATRRVTPQPGLRVRLVHDLQAVIHPSAAPLGCDSNGRYSTSAMRPLRQEGFSTLSSGRRSGE